MVEAVVGFVRSKLEVPVVLSLCFNLVFEKQLRELSSRKMAIIWDGLKWLGVEVSGGKVNLRQWLFDP